MSDPARFHPLAADTVERLLALLETHGVQEFSYEDGALTLEVRGGRVELPSLPPKRQGSISSPTVGLFRPGKGDLPRRIAAGERVGMIATGHMLLPVLAPGPGLLIEACQAADTGVGYGEALYIYEQD